MSRAPIRRPLLALLVLVAAVAIGYGIRAVHEDHRTHPAPTHASAATQRAAAPPHGDAQRAVVGAD